MSPTSRLILAVCLLLIAALLYLLFQRMGASPKAQQLADFANSAQFNPATQRFQNSLATPKSFTRPRSEVMYDFFFKNQDAKPTKKLPEAPPLLAELQQKSQAARFIWFGHSTLLLDIDGLRLLIDPVFSNHAFPLPLLIKRFQAPALALTQIPDIDAVLISHDHYDHLDYDSIQQLKDQNIEFFTPLGVNAHLEAWGVAANKIHSLDWWQSLNFNGLQLTAAPAQHFSGRSFGKRNQTLWCSWAIKGQQQNLYFSGDSGYSPHYQAIGQRLGPFDLTFLENGAYNKDWYSMHQFPEQVIQAQQDLRGNWLVPIHWAMFDLSLHPWYEPIERLSALAKTADIILVTPQLGALVASDGAPPVRDWWSAYIP